MSRIKNNTEGFFSRGTSPKKESGSAIKTVDLSFPSHSNYFKLTTPKTEKSTIHDCFCGTCKVLGIEHIKSIYNSGHMLEENSRLIFDPLFEKVPGY